MHDLTQAARTHRLWAEIDLDCLARNGRIAQALAGKGTVIPVLKADGYGHGAVPCARHLEANGFEMFAVACAEEAFQLRRHGIKSPIMLLGDAQPAQVRELARQNVILVLGSLQSAREVAAALDGERAQVHIKLDSGMHRCGLDITGQNQTSEDPVAALREIRGMKCFAVQGILTHFATADLAPDDAFTALQIERFLAFTDSYAADLPRHCANSAGLLDHPAARLDFVRPGLLMYGYHPRGRAAEEAAGLRPALSLRTAIRELHRIGPGEGASYGLTWKAGAPRLVATVSIGYADGLLRNLSDQTCMLVRGGRAPQVGRICMDMSIIDVTDIPGVQVGDVVTVIGRDIQNGELRYDAQDMADRLGTISYELICALSKRIPRYYLAGGAVADQVSYLASL